MSSLDQSDLPEVARLEVILRAQAHRELMAFVGTMSALEGHERAAEILGEFEHLASFEPPF